jgi:hypothetical protein
MGSSLELNDTLQITTEQGFPADVLDLQRHQIQPITIADLGGRRFTFQGKPGARFFQLDPVRVYLVHNVNGKWLFWGHAFVQDQTIAKQVGPDGTWMSGNWVTSGSFTVSQIYPPDYQKLFTITESPPGLSFF